MGTAAKSAQGVQLKSGDGAGPEVFTKIGELKDISGPDEASDQLDATSLDSTSKEFIGGLRDGGEVKCAVISLLPDSKAATASG